MKEFTSASYYVKLKKEELDSLCTEIKKIYEADGGRFALGEASPKNYEDLANHFKNRLSQNKCKLSYKDSAKVEHKNVQDPGSGFLCDIFYNRKKKETTHRQYKIDLCYLYVYGELRDSYLKRRKESKNKKGKSIQLVLSAVSSYGKEVAEVKKRIQEEYGYTVKNDTRDVKSPNIGSLIDYYNGASQNKDFIIILIGKDCFKTETFVKELNNIKRAIPEKFLNHSILITLPDICDGACNINTVSGRHSVSEFWREQRTYLDEITIPEIKAHFPPQEKKLALKRAIEEKNNLRTILSEIDSLLDLIKTSRPTPYKHFMNHFSVEEFNKLLASAVSLIPVEEIHETRKNLLTPKAKKKEQKEERKIFVRRKE